MSHHRAVVCVFVLFASWGLPARGQPTRTSEQGVVFVAGGAGDIRLIVSSMERAVARSGLPLSVAVVDWASGDLPEDIRNRDSHQRAGHALAQRVLAYHKARPGRKVFLVGHSAGPAVVLAATHGLPANSVERIILLAPVVSSHHDLRRALAASRCGIDHFYSQDDVPLQACVTLFGTTDGRGTRSAGEVGFVPIIACEADAVLYRKLRQHPWRPEYADVGYFAGHFGVARQTFLSHAVVPLFTAR